jgi:hypothetical protein
MTQPENKKVIFFFNDKNILLPLVGS